MLIVSDIHIRIKFYIQLIPVGSESMDTEGCLYYLIYIRDLSIRGFCYQQWVGGGGGSPGTNQPPPPHEYQGVTVIM